MGQSTEELTHEIAETRAALTTDVDALQDKVSPAAIIERRKAAARSRLGTIRSRVMGSVHDVRNSAAGGTSSAVGSTQDAVGGAVDTVEEKYAGSPLAAGLVAFGAGMVIASLLPASDKEARLAAQALDTAQEKGQPLVEQAKSVGQDVAYGVSGSVGEAVQEVKSAATDGADHVKSEGQSSVGAVRSEAGSS